MKFSDDKKTLIHVDKNYTHNGPFAIPDSVEVINDWAFFECFNLTQVIIPNSVTHIGKGAFGQCHRLNQVIIPNSVTHIGIGAFYGCTGLTQVIIPNSVTHIGNGAFARCTGLTQVIIPNSVTHIGNSAFYGCTGLTQVIIPNSVTHIGEEAFKECTSLIEITIPDSIEKIAHDAFGKCTSLKTVNIQGSNITVKYLENIFANFPNIGNIQINFTDPTQYEKIIKDEALSDNLKMLIEKSQMESMSFNDLYNTAQPLSSDTSCQELINKASLLYKNNHKNAAKDMLKILLTMHRERDRLDTNRLNQIINTYPAVKEHRGFKYIFVLLEKAYNYFKSEQNQSDSSEKHGFFKTASENMLGSYGQELIKKK